METNIFGRCIFRSPCKSSLSSVETIRDAISKTDRNDFIITVKKVAIPLSVTVRLSMPGLKLKTALPSLTNGIKIEAARGYRKTKKVLLRNIFGLGLNKKIIIMQMKNAKENSKYSPLPRLTIIIILTKVINNLVLASKRIFFNKLHFFLALPNL
jgi:hypothetical protein